MGEFGTIAIIGLGYVGLPLALEFSKQNNVIGFDINRQKIEKYKNGTDVTNNVGSQSLKDSKCFYTSEESCLKQADIFIIAVPTPISADKIPDLSPVISASEIVGRNFSKGATIVYESTVYPGVTEDICVKILEKESGLKCGKDFKVGYSPERINPGDNLHTLRTIKKIVSGMDDETLNRVARLYETVVDAGIYRAENIKVAEAAKVAENAQRDINIAFMNELAMVFSSMGIDTNEVINAMNTKWNALGFTPGLVGGHCIGVDPYYFIYKAEQLGYHSQIIMAGRKINDGIGDFIGNAVIRKLIEADKKVKNSNIAVLGITFKENCADSRNTKVIDIIKTLVSYSINVIVVDPVADKEDILLHYGLNLCKIEEVRNMDAVILAVPHKCFRELQLSDFSIMFRDSSKILIDVKSVINKREAISNNFTYWNL